MWVTPEQIEKAKRIDLLTYLQSYEPGNLKKISHDTWCIKEHDSLKISNGKWHWFSRHIGGKTALDYLRKGKGVSFMENNVGWHGKAPNDEEFAIAMEDLRKAGEALCQK